MRASARIPSEACFVTRAIEKRELLRLAEHRQRGLRLRVDHAEVPPRVGQGKHHPVDFEANHRTDEIDVFVEGIVVNLDLVAAKLLAEIRQHRIVDDEVGATTLRPVDCCEKRVSPWAEKF